jgi:hypothetical protein
VGESTVFMYPQLLPTMALQPDAVSKVVTWTDHEDHLLAIGKALFT